METAKTTCRLVFFCGLLYAEYWYATMAIMGAGECHNTYLYRIVVANRIIASEKPHDCEIVAFPISFIRPF